MPANRIVGPIDENQVVTLTNNIHPMARGEFETGTLAADTQLNRMMLQLRPSAEQQAELNDLVQEQHDPSSPLYHQWLTPAEYGARFGASSGDIGRIAGWLQNHGFTIDEVPAGNRLVLFSGTAGQVAETFHTEIHHYSVNGASHIANAQDPQIPSAFADVVRGIVSLHDFRRQPQITAKRSLRRTASGSTRPQYSYGGSNLLFPGDLATIYDLNTLYKSGKTGAGTTIAIVGRSNINIQDVTQFRSASGLSANNPKVTLVGPDPGLVPGDQDESTLDVEWSGGVAPGATVNFVVGNSTGTSDGVDLSAQYIVNHAVSQVISTSYGSCEQAMGSTELAFYNSLWQQAASQGMSAFVSSGDSGAAGCYGGSSTTASGTGVNGLCSSPYSTCVGGTEFNEGSNKSEYWSATNGAGFESALSYIPEVVWNESGSNGGADLWASTGGISLVYPQPTWQKGVTGASQSNGMRGVPDVALDAASHDAYTIVENDNYYTIAGTSAASPSFAGIMALVVQAHGGTGQGNANPSLYALVNATQNPFHPTPSGNNSVPGVTGFTANGAAYNLATGLGSVDGALLVSSWGSGSAGITSSTDFTLKSSANNGTVLAGKTTTFTITAAASGSAKNAITLKASAPTGVTATISPASILPGATATVTIAAASNTAPGTQNVTVAGTDTSGSLTVTYALTVTAAPTLTIAESSSSLTLTAGNKGTVGFTATTGGSYTGPLSFTLSGLPAGVTASWSANPVTPAAGASSTTETLTLTAAANAPASTTSLTITAVGDGLTATQPVSLAVQVPAGVQLATSPASLTVQSLSSVKATITATPVGGAAIPAGAAGSTISIASGLPRGFTASWSAPALSATGAATWTLTLTGSPTAAAGSSTLSITSKIVVKTGASYSVSQSLPLSVTLTPPTLAIASSSSASVTQGKSVAVTGTLTANGTYTGPVTLSATNLPAEMTASWSQNPVTLQSGSASWTLTLTASSTATVASTPVNIYASGDGITSAARVSLQVQQAPALKASLGANSLSIAHTASGTMSVTIIPLGGLSAPVKLSVSGLPAGVTSTFNSATLGTPGSGTATLTLKGSSAAKAGSYNVTITAISVATASNSHTYTASQTLLLTLK